MLLLLETPSKKKKKSYRECDFNAKDTLVCQSKEIPNYFIL